MCVCIWICMFVCLHVYECVYTCGCTLVYILINMWMLTYTYFHINTPKYYMTHNHMLPSCAKGLLTTRILRAVECEEGWLFAIDVEEVPFTAQNLRQKWRSSQTVPCSCWDGVYQLSQNKSKIFTNIQVCRHIQMLNGCRWDLYEFESLPFSAISHCVCVFVCAECIYKYNLRDPHYCHTRITQERRTVTIHSVSMASSYQRWGASAVTHLSISGPETHSFCEGLTGHHHTERGPSP